MKNLHIILFVLLIFQLFNSCKDEKGGNNERKMVKPTIEHPQVDFLQPNESKAFYGKGELYFFKDAFGDFRSNLEFQTSANPKDNFSLWLKQSDNTNWIEQIEHFNLPHEQNEITFFRPSGQDENWYAGISLANVIINPKEGDSIDIRLTYKGQYDNIIQELNNIKITFINPFMGDKLYPNGFPDLKLYENHGRDSIFVFGVNHKKGMLDIYDDSGLPWCKINLVSGEIINLNVLHDERGRKEFIILNPNKRDLRYYNSVQKIILELDRWISSQRSYETQLKEEDDEIIRGLIQEGIERRGSKRDTIDELILGEYNKLKENLYRLQSTDAKIIKVNYWFNKIKEENVMQIYFDAETENFNNATLYYVISDNNDRIFNAFDLLISAPINSRNTMHTTRHFEEEVQKRLSLKSTKTNKDVGFHTSRTR